MSRIQGLRTGYGWGLFVLLAINGCAQSSAPANSAAPLPQVVQFNRDIRPILSDKCFTCHGPDQTHRTTNFHFDVEESAKGDIGGGQYPVYPGNLEKSLLIQRVTAQNEDERMPPVSTGRKLSEREIAVLKEWIQQGAKWEKHWSFMPPKRPEVPKVQEVSWTKNPIDNFVAKRLEKEGIRPSREADRATLLRRVTLDLTGKGPTAKELDAFLVDKSPNAYEKVVDRLIASPQYGERMALPWLDAARYADTDGYQVDYERFMWRWRDWVINAFNKNMPYDQFTIEQLAGDMLPNPTLDQKIATAFNRNHRTNGEGGVIPEEYAAEYVVDRVSTTSSVFLGLTLGCARCHDHKYDPFTQKEFYQLYSYFNNVPELGRARRGNSEPFIKAPTPEQDASLKQLDNQVAAAESKFSKLEPVLHSSETAWLKSLAGGQTIQWTPSHDLVAHFTLDGNLAGTGKNLPAASWKGDGQFSQGRLGQAASFDGKSFIEAGNIAGFDDNNKFTIGAWIYPTSGNGAIVSKNSDNDPLTEPERRGYSLELREGRLHFSVAFRWIDHGIRLESDKPMDLNRWHHVMVSYGGARAAASVKLYVDGVVQAQNIQLDILNESPRTQDPVRIGGGGGPANRFHGLIDDVRIYETNLTPEEVGVLSVAEPLNALAASSQLSQFAANKVRSAFLESAAVPGDVRDAFQQLKMLQAQRAQLDSSISTLMVMQDMQAPRESHVLLRGAYDMPGDRVTPDVPAILPPMPKDYPKNRLGLARWLVDPTNPLTARVAVNRFWQMYFGTGIVKTVDDFGSQGEVPSHPELLDWLATEFMRTGWDVKAIQRLIVTSSTYRQASEASAEAVQRDPENRLLARGARFRLPAETVRDQALAMADLLVEKVGGPSVKPYQPDGLWLDLVQDGNGRNRYVQDHGDKLYRRSLYSFWKRTIPPPAMANFDAPSRESCILQRGVTNSPLQALDLMNDVTFLEAARMLAERMMKEGGSTSETRIDYAFRLATGRMPNQRETQILLNAFRRALDRFQTKSDAAVEYLDVGEHARDQNLDAKEVAAYANVASLILNLDEAVTRE